MGLRKNTDTQLDADPDIGGNRSKQTENIPLFPFQNKSKYLPTKTNAWPASKLCGVVEKMVIKIWFWARC